MFNPGLTRFLFNEVLANDFTEQFEKMITNHTDRKKVKIVLKYKTGKGKKDYIKKTICGYFNCGCQTCSSSRICKICKKIGEELHNMKNYQGYEAITAKVRKVNGDSFQALINY